MARDRIRGLAAATSRPIRLRRWAAAIITNVVLMGMGEPLYNFDNVKDAMEIVSDGEGISLSKRRITLSTSGVVPEIPRAGEEIGTMLAISLHGTTDEIRDKLVPLNKKYPIKELLRGLPQLSGPVQRPAHHLRICDAEGRQRHAGRCQAAGAAAQGHSRQGQSHSLQSLARHAI